MKPLVSYYGGKQRIASKILSYIEAIPHLVYAEPYAGGCALLFAKPYRDAPAAHRVEAINDINDNLITLYRVAKKQPDLLFREIEATLYSQSDFNRARSILKTDSASELDRAWATYVVLHQSANNKFGSSWGRALASSAAEEFYNHRLRLPKILARLNTVHVSCTDALTFIRNWDRPHTLFYVDPPYPSTDQGHYKGYNQADWQSLCQTLDSIQGSYVLSGYANETQPESATLRLELDAKMSVFCPLGVPDSFNKKIDYNRKEVLWVCDRSASMKPELLSKAMKYVKPL